MKLLIYLAKAIILKDPQNCHYSRNISFEYCNINNGDLDGVIKITVPISLSHKIINEIFAWF